MSELPPPFQTPFSRDKQVRFLEALALWGGVRAACRAVPASPQTVYRHRRASRDFALAWDAALLVARPQVEDVLADRALNGIEEVIYYHGEEIGRRRRYDSRLLLAHLARLDKAEESNDILDVAHDFDAALERLRRGEPIDPYAPDDDADDDTPVTYGERWEDESLPFPERAELYHRWLHEEDGEGDDDALPDPYACEEDEEEEPFDAAKYMLRRSSERAEHKALKQRSGSAEIDALKQRSGSAEIDALRQRSGSAQETLLDPVTPVTLQHEAAGPPAASEQACAPAQAASRDLPEVPACTETHPPRFRAPAMPILDGRCSVYRNGAYSG